VSSIAYNKASTLPEAIALSAANPNMPVLAGGTDLIVQWRSGLISPPGFVDISSVAELRTISANDTFIEIGACATHAAIAADAGVNLHLPALAKACLSIGAAQIQNRGTIGGNIMNASPAGDTLPVVLAYGAELKLESVKGARWVSAVDFFTGYRKTAKNSDELLTRIKFPRRYSKDLRSEFYKIGTRRAQAISKAAMCIVAEVSRGAIVEIAIAVGSVAPTAVRAFGTEALLRGRAVTVPVIDSAKASITDEFSPIDDVRSTEDYRRFVCGSMLANFLSGLTKKNTPV
jgi:CO/xanthine dehydrogenase FAD-binding subunit